MAANSHPQLTVRPGPATGRSSESPRSKMDNRTPSPTRTIMPSGSSGSSLCKSRKRTNDEVYLPSQMGYKSPPCNFEASKRPSTAPEQNARHQSFSITANEPTELSVLRSNHAFNSSISARSRSKPKTQSASEYNAVENKTTFQDAMKDFQAQLDEEFTSFEQKLKERDQVEELEEFDWDELESRYHAAIDPKVEAEQNIMNECSHLLQHFLIWMQMSSEREGDRALKRLRTRMAFVQVSEDTLREKRAHYSKVVNAFHSAMALLGNI